METRRLAALGAGEPPDQLLLRGRMGIVNVLDAWGHLDKAGELCAKVYKLQAEHLGPDHPDALRSLMNLAVRSGSGSPPWLSQ